jgi:hypothetical protein
MDRSKDNDLKVLQEKQIENAVQELKYLAMVSEEQMGALGEH